MITYNKDYATANIYPLTRESQLNGIAYPLKLNGNVQGCRESPYLTAEMTALSSSAKV